MRARLLDATVDVLAEDGYAATTLRAVAARAGVSSGAMTHHFPRRVDLVGGALEHLAEQRIAAMHVQLERRGDAAVRVRDLLDVLWEDFSGPLVTVFVKIWVAAADDPELYERLIPLERRLARTIAAGIAELGADLDREDLEGRMLTVLSTIRGLALTQAFEPRRGRARDRWPRVRPFLERVLLDP